MQSQPTFRAYIVSTLFLIIIGWSGLAALMTFTVPTVWPRWGFFLLWVMALTGLALPVSYFMNQQFPSDPPAESNVIVRQALWVGIYGATLAWLQLGRLVTLYVIFGLAGGLIAIEYFLRMRERARWRPPLDPDEPTQ
ncbi:MAG: hypothetical protein MUO77_17165 [Anaerolineales bacterium]|nr:hypothetical protein [Anaerolineales bacterium]